MKQKKDHHQKADLIISGQYLLPTAQESDVIINGAIAIKDDRILATGPAAELATRFPETKILHEPHGLIMPGLINTHTHAAMSCLRGMADDLELMGWLQDHIFPIEAQLTPQMVYQSTQLSIAEMIRSGTTSFCDMYLFSKEVARAAAESGMRAWIGEVLYDFPSPCYGELENGFAYTRELLAEYDNHPTISITVDPHSVYTCAPSLLERLNIMAQDHQSLIVIHLSENAAEVNGCQAQYGCSPVEHLDRLGLLHDRTLAAHCVILNEDEIDLLAKRDVKVSHCPESNMKLASGVAPIPQMLAAGITVGLGSDGAASNNNVDLFGEMNSAAKLHKVTTLDPTVMDSSTTLHAATQGGADCLLAGGSVGSLTPGKKADLIILDLNQPHLTPLYHLPSHLVYAARGTDVIHSMINGRFVMQQRQLLTLDEKAILAQAQALGKTILACRKS